ncbi:hypothetical protein MMC17_001099 [Xylographa soralifera]|nr:hypothetical protein [Xylographa soralifera]
METVQLTSYRNPRHLGDLLKTTKIWQAARATSAASTSFESIEIGPNDEEFVDGASGANNPIRELWTEASTVAPAIRRFDSGMVEVAKTLKDISLETEKTVKKFGDEHYQLRLEGRYFRFNVTKGLEDVGLEHADKKRDIAAAARAYIYETKDEMEKRYNNLKERECYPTTRDAARLSPRPIMKGSHAFPTFDTAGDLSRNLIDRPEILQTISDCLEQTPVDRWLERRASFYWVDASSSSTLDQSFRSFARDTSIINAVASTSDNPAYVRRKVCDWIVKFGGEWLLVYDNYDIMELREDDGYDISIYFPLSVSGGILVTARNREVQTVTGGTLVDIGTMTEEEAIALFVTSAYLELPNQTSR